jgi:hypothetical protein
MEVSKRSFLYKDDRSDGIFVLGIWMRFVFVVVVLGLERFLLGVFALSVIGREDCVCGF